jgi:hypothetical protein
VFSELDLCKDARGRVKSTARLLDIAMSKLVLTCLLMLAGCGRAPNPSVTIPLAEKPPSNVATMPLSQIDLTQIGAVAPKGRVQDRDYNHLPVVEDLIAHGNEAIPFLIGKLDDETRINDHVFDQWSEVRVGDLAFAILTDFFTDPTSQKGTIPGVGYDEFLQRAPNSNVTGEQLLRNYLAKHGRPDITKRWRNIWARYKDRVHWDEHDRCFKLRDS